MRLGTLPKDPHVLRMCVPSSVAEQNFMSVSPDSPAK